MQPICCHDFELINLQNESDLFSLLDWKESHYQRARQWRSSGYVHPQLNQVSTEGGRLISSGQSPMIVVLIELKSLPNISSSP